MGERGDALGRAAIRQVPSERVAELNALTLRALAHWGYSRAELQIFARELELGPGDLAAGIARQLELAGSALGFYLLVERDRHAAELERLFVEPAWLRRGIGSRLLAHAGEIARTRGFSRMLILANPHAEGFYRAQGAVRIGEEPSSLPGRVLPLLELSLGAPPAPGPRSTPPSRETKP